MRRALIRLSFRLTLALAMLSAAATTGSAQQRRVPQARPETPAAAALRAEVEGLNRALEETFARGDMKAVAAFYADSAVIRTPRSVAARGRAELDAYFAGIANAKGWKLEVYGVDQGANGLVFQTGRSMLTMADDHVATVEFSLVWQRDATGRLRILLDYYHVPEPARAMTRPPTGEG
jgi:ketosteroid isomerase-like protein